MKDICRLWRGEGKCFCTGLLSIIVTLRSHAGIWLEINGACAIMGLRRQRRKTTTIQTILFINIQTKPSPSAPNAVPLFPRTSNATNPKKAITPDKNNTYSNPPPPSTPSTPLPLPLTTFFLKPSSLLASTASTAFLRSASRAW